MYVTFVLSALCLVFVLVLVVGLMWGLTGALLVVLLRDHTTEGALHNTTHSDSSVMWV